MKKLFLLLMFVSFGVFSQNKTVNVSDIHKPFFSALKKMNGYSNVIFPASALEVYAGNVLLYTEYNDSVWRINIMPDGEYRFFKKDYGDDVESYVVYLRYLNDKVFGYSLITYKDGRINVSVHRSPYPRIYDYEFKPVK